MWPKTPLTELLEIEAPLLLAPMAGISLAPLAAAVSAAGGLGALGSAILPPPELAAEVGRLRAVTTRPFALNFFAHRPPREEAARAVAAMERLLPFHQEMGLGGFPPLAPPPPFGGPLVEMVLELAPRAVSFHFGLPEAAVLRRYKDAGILILSTATTVEEAKLLEASGVDAIIAQGFEAGGHRGTFTSDFEAGAVGTLALVPQIVDAVALPVVAAGGIADGRAIAAVLALGAAGAQLGTAFLGCPEASLDPVYRRRLAEPAAARTRVTKLLSGRPARAVVNRFLEDLADFEEGTPDFPLQYLLTAPLRKASVERDSPDFHAVWAGQAAPLMKPQPAAELMARLEAETSAALARLSRLQDGAAGRGRRSG